MGNVAQDLQQVVNDFNMKLRHISVFSQELAKTLLPNKKCGKFKNQQDLASSIKNREEIIKHGELMCNWILKNS